VGQFWTPILGQFWMPIDTLSTYLEQTQSICQSATTSDSHKQASSVPLRSASSRSRGILSKCSLYVLSRVFSLYQKVKQKYGNNDNLKEQHSSTECPTTSRNIVSEVSAGEIHCTTIDRPKFQKLLRSSRTAISS